MTAPVTHFLPLTLIRRARMLSAPGRVVVRPGQQVNATDVIAEAVLSDSHLLLDVRRALNLPTAGKAESLIQRKAGEKVQKGDVLAETGGLFSRVIRAPANGTVVAISSGQVILETEGPAAVLLAAMPGTVTEVLPERGAVIETNGVLVQGVWGNGRVDLGLLLALARAPEEELTRAKMDVSMRGAVVMAGTCQQADALKTAAELPLRGLILGSMNPDLIPLANSLKLPVIVIEGFGRIPLSVPVYKLLTTNEKRDVSLNAVPWNRYTGERPEVIIALPAAGETAPETVEYQAGQTVRIQGAPYTGQVGTIIGLKQGSAALPNGLRAPAAEIRLLDVNEKVIIPLANLDVLE